MGVPDSGRAILLILGCAAACASGCHLGSRDAGGYPSTAVTAGEQRPEDQAIVRLYNAPIYRSLPFATHHWFVIKRPDADRLDRWEVWQTAGGPYEHVRKNLLAPEDDVGAGGVKLLAELVGPEAEPIVEFIETRSPEYPCRQHYFVLGPNSNTYPQWVLDQTGWNVELPASAVGKTASVDCE